MAIVTLEQVKEQLAFTDDLGTTDDALLGRKIAAAQNHVERLLGFKIEAQFGGTDQEAVPPALVEAVSQLAAWWYESREAAGPNVQEIPFGVQEVVREYRGFSF
ncbi:hypothetical protein Rumeso_04735 [Rubellimicrobium mesophilum DSM 19309]|uniref:DNA-packaging protein n=1 Tax=Rubellimicrobium mesophilum DSM 19309 TaxID=442562 RepID=A0A017HIM0_9RHOB|nr:head-tail connector protein [Rubellimicrobium mesophilum]EYD73614.1 hypothetical protein Rumeso_04735 [Rubellimicrobium mesophilum DSM 19309]